MDSLEIIYGIHSVRAMLDSSPQSVLNLYVQETRKDQRVRSLIAKAKKLDVSIVRVSRDKLDDLTDAHHQGIVAVATRCEYSDTFNEESLISILKNRESPALLLILDGVKDPHNLGASLRSADAFGVQVVIVPKDRAVGITSTVRKIACGATQAIPFIRVTNLSRTLLSLQKEGVWIVGTTAEAASHIQDVDLTGDIAIVLGSEGKGMRQLTMQRCDFLVKIPLEGTVESLNVSVACGICLYEVRRQRKIYQVTNHNCI
ncbi:23S rRNA (guanosine(2251)-2'-O)-methyltransferase RlmB [Coxiella endosymbiont of Amblyomma nuttalli]|uniref:23S rRNA (guanosine(2251)-2'-O)-methyltransferase RlmB n=1 Tax=Coxiella endosymbiont of Amblyomma nuttalli TaxID=2749996 RepID=UPI001BA5B5E4|nr:23S rRNA (guanosine(2251)-2'-O)-methyltransferase RlmB [Coxiella endosymbiont of Amblyomma nuttalli]QTS83935.1 23S rRNA (guanosine-2'-O-)-methyltransferase RlmB [Coxiella endosymbiont of Amblyomma nuttalli]